MGLVGVPAPPELSPQIWAAFEGSAEDERKSRINDGVAGDPRRKHNCPQCGQLRGLLRCPEVGSKIEKYYHFCGPYPQTLTATTKNQGSPPGKEPILSKKEKFALYLTPEKKAVLERRYREDGSRSLTAFIERAVDFYLDYLSANDAGLFLPTALKSYVDGRLGQMEDRMSSLLYKQAVEQDMVAGILADAYQFSEEDLKRRRAESISNVKKTNGRVSLDQRVREAWEEGDEWQD
jgi:hypothetical protein